MRRSDDSERFPVLYATDSDGFFGAFADLANILQAHGETRRFILVAIGYENAHAAGLLRMRDLFTHANRAHFQAVIEQLAASPLVGGLDDVKSITETTDASDFLQFILRELVPFVADRYPALPDDNSYFGYSAGGTFGLYTLFTEPRAFRRYILGSPATSYEGHHFATELARAFIGSGRVMDATVFMSVGELEEPGNAMGQFDLVTGYYLLAKFLQRAAIPGLDLRLRLFPGETHATAWTPAFSHGLKMLLGPAQEARHGPQFLGQARD